MKRIVFYCLLALLLSGCVMSRKYAQLGQPGPIARDSVKVDELIAKHRGFDAFYLDYRKTFEHYLSPGWTYNIICESVYVVIAPVSIFGEFKESISPGGEMKNAYMRVIYPGGTVRNFTLADCKKEKNSRGQITYKLAYPDITPGTIVMEGWEKTYDEHLEVNESIDIAFSVPCQHVRFDFVSPGKWDIALRKNDKLIQEKIRTTNDTESGKLIVTYEDTDVPGIKDEPYSPSARELGYFLDIMLKKVIFSSFGDIVTAKNYKSWPGVFGDLGRAMGYMEIMSEPSVKDKVNQLITSSSSEYERADSLIRFIQREIDLVYYTSNGSFSETLASKKASVLEMTGLACLMLKTAGIRAKFALCHAMNDGPLDQEFYNSSMYPMPAVVFDVDQTRFVVFPYLKFFNLNKVPWMYAGQPALLIEYQSDKFMTDTVDKKVKQKKYQTFYFRDITTIPIFLPEDRSMGNIIESFQDIAIEESGQMTVTERIVFPEDFASLYREAFEELKDEERQKFFRELLCVYDAKVEMVDAKAINLRDYSKPLIFSLTYKIDNLVTILPDEVIVQTNGLLSPAVSKKTRIIAEDRINPIYIRQDESLIKHVTISHPSGWTVQAPLQNEDIINQFGRTTITYKQTEGKIHIDQTRFLRKSNQPREDYPLLLQLAGEKAAFVLPSIIFDVKPM